MITIKEELRNFVRPSAHSKYSPSSMDRVLTCPFSVEFIKNIPEETSSYAAEGSVAHSVCEATFFYDQYGIDFPLELQMEMTKYDQNEMLECAQGQLGVLNYWLNNTSQVGEILLYGIEKGIPIYPKLGAFGTADFMAVGTKAAVIEDYKHGKGKNVAADSWQLLSYLAGIYLHLENIPDDYLFIAVVYQPRTDIAPKEHTYTIAEVKAFAEKILEGIHESQKPNLQPVEGKCFWCPASRTKQVEFKCPALKQKTIKLAEENFAGFLADMNAPVDDVKAVNARRDEALIKLITLYPMIKKVAEDGLEEFQLRVEAGEKIAGVVLTEKVGNREINGENEADKLQEIMKIAVNKHFTDFKATKEVPATTKLKTLTELEKELGKGALDPICTRKITKKVEILDDKTRSILGEMLNFSKTLTTSPEEN